MAGETGLEISLNAKDHLLYAQKTQKCVIGNRNSVYRARASCTACMIVVRVDI